MLGDDGGRFALLWDFAQHWWKPSFFDFQSSESLRNFRRICATMAPVSILKEFVAGRQVFEVPQPKRQKVHEKKVVVKPDQKTRLAGFIY